MATGTPFGLETLRLLDFGKINAAFQAELNRVVFDCLDRPGDNKPRKVNISFTFIPRPDPSGEVRDCDRLLVEADITSTVPKRRTRVYEMTHSANGTLVFNPDVPDDPSQPTIFEAQERKDDVG